MGEQAAMPDCFKAPDTCAKCGGPLALNDVKLLEPQPYGVRDLGYHLPGCDPRRRHAR